MKAKIFGISTLLFSTASIIALYTGKPWQMLLLVLSIFIYIACSKDCRGSESTWLFVLIAIVAVPLNIRMILSNINYFTLFTSGKIGKITATIVAFSILFSFEELFLGLVGRCIWRQQDTD